MVGLFWVVVGVFCVWWWVVLGLFWMVGVGNGIVMGGGEWLWVYFGWWWVVVGSFLVVMGSGGSWYGL